jgi:RNA polymerase subunit RPABC4/transcription elongation factor Spt4
MYSACEVCTSVYPAEMPACPLCCKDNDWSGFPDVADWNAAPVVPESASTAAVVR